MFAQNLRMFMLKQIADSYKKESIKIMIYLASLLP